MDQLNHPVAIAIISAALAVCGVSLFATPDALKEDPHGSLHITAQPGQRVFINGIDVLAKLDDVGQGNTNILTMLENCRKTCPPGQYVRQQCNATSANVCSACPAGTYSPTQGLDSVCLACKPCGPGTFASSCNPVTGEPICDTCPSDTYQDLKTHWETECKPCTCPKGTLPIGECVADEAFECVPNNGIEVLPSHGCPANSWRLTEKFNGCHQGKSSPGSLMMKIDVGDNGEDYFDVVATSRVRFASGTYEFHCHADDCCWITLSGPALLRPINPNCGRGTSRGNGHREQRFIEGGTYTVELKGHEFTGAFNANFEAKRL